MPNILMMHGKPLSGKSYTAELLKNSLESSGEKYVILKSVVMRYDNKPVEFTEYSVDETIPLTKKDKDRSYRAVIKAAQIELSAGNNVILDATFHIQYRRKWVYDLAHKFKAELVIIWMKLDNEEKIYRLLDERQVNRDFKDNILYTWAQYDTMVQQYEPFVNNTKKTIKVDCDNGKITALNCDKQDKLIKAIIGIIVNKVFN